jgi:hypothetical protein
MDTDEQAVTHSLLSHIVALVSNMRSLKHLQSDRVTCGLFPSACSYMNRSGPALRARPWQRLVGLFLRCLSERVRFDSARICAGFSDKQRGELMLTCHTRVIARRPITMVLGVGLLVLSGLAAVSPACSREREIHDRFCHWRKV